jgi:hypothetical protein
MLYLDCSCLNLSLEFFRKFCDFSSIFRAFKTISTFSGIFSGNKNKFEKRKTYPNGPHRPRWPSRQARQGPSAKPSQGNGRRYLGVRA